MAEKPTVFTTFRVQEMLDENFEYIKLIADCQKRGQTVEANQYSQKLHANLSLMAKVADAQIPVDVNQVLARVERPGGKSAAGHCPAHLTPVQGGGPSASLALPLESSLANATAAASPETAAAGPAAMCALASTAASHPVQGGVQG